MSSCLRWVLVWVLAAAVHLAAPRHAQADPVFDWNAIAVQVSAANGQNPFVQARTLAIVQLAVFEAVNAIVGDYQPYAGTVHAPAGASAEAAAIAAAYKVLATYFPASIATLAAARAASLATLADGSAKDDGIAVGEAAAAALMALRAADGAFPPSFYVPGALVPGMWQATPSCPADSNGVKRGVFAHWGAVTPFAIPSVADFMPGPPPALDSSEYRKAYAEVAEVGSDSSVSRPPDRADVVRFYAVSSPAFVFGAIARQVAGARVPSSLSENARAFALISMAVNDALIVSFATKYHYLFWRPETAIRAGDTDGNDRTEVDPYYAPYIATPCFPSYPSNHASGSSAGAEVLRRLYGEAGHDFALENPTAPGIVLRYSAFHEVTADVDDARVYGGIHFRFDQDTGDTLGRNVATWVVLHALRPRNGR